MQLYVLQEAGQVEVLKVKVQKICVLINLSMIFILFYYFFVLNIFYFVNIACSYVFVKHTSHGFLFYQLSKQTAFQINTRH